jgi:HEAT repeat protein
VVKPCTLFLLVVSIGFEQERIVPFLIDSLSFQSTQTSMGKVDEHLEPHGRWKLPYPETLLLALPQADQHLRSALTHSSPRVRAAAARLLATETRPQPRDIAVLTKALGDDNPDVRRWAAVGLAARDALKEQDFTILVEALPDWGGTTTIKAKYYHFDWHGLAAERLRASGARAIPALLKGLSAEDASIQAGCAEVLGNLGDLAKPAIPQLTRMLKGSELPVRVIAALALSKIERSPTQYFHVLLEGVQAQGPLTRAVKSNLHLRLVTASEMQLDQYNGNLLQSIQGNRINLLRAEILRSAATLKPQLIQALAHQDPGAQFTASTTLSTLVQTAPETITDLTDALGDKDARIRAAVLAILGGQKLDNAAVLKVAEALGDPYVHIRVCAAQALWRITGDAEVALPVLIVGLNAVEARTRILAAETLGSQESQAALAVPILTELLGDESTSIQNAAIAALYRIAAEAKQPFLDALTHPEQRVRFTAARVLGEKLGPVAMPDLLARLQDVDREQTLLAARAIGYMHGEVREALPVLRPLLKSEEPDIRYECARTYFLVGGGSAEVLPVLLDLLPNSPPDRQIAITYLLGNMGERAASALPHVRHLLSAGPENVRIAVIRTIPYLGIKAESAVPDLIELLQDPTIEIRREAAYAMRQMAHKKYTTPVLLAGLLLASGNADPDVRESGLERLDHFTHDMAFVVPALLRGLKDDDTNVRYAAEDTLFMLGPQAIPFLIAGMGDESPAVRKFIPELFQDLGPEAKSAIPALILSLNDPDPDVRKQVERTLKYLDR